VTLKVVFDTNIYISAFAIPGGKAEEAYLSALRNEFVLYTSVAILTETAQILRENFDWPEDAVIRLLKAVAKAAIVVKPRHSLHLLADEPDNRILECAAETKADFIVTGDKHLLSLGRYQTTSISRLSDFLRNLPGRA
jgi:uncharacterized protein